MCALRVHVTMLCVAGLLSGCALPYYWQAVGGQLGLLRKRMPIEELIADPGTDPEVRSSLRQILEIHSFATMDLGLPDNGSYRTYVDLGRPYVVWNVVAAEEFSVEPLTWCFPFAGCVSYRGYFDEQAARRFSARLEANGLDTAVAGATAYSTLGYFADPVLNTMIGIGSHGIAALLIHELAHQRFYVKGDTELNEAFATVVEEYGTELWLTRSGDFEGIAEFRQRVRRRTEFSELVRQQQERLRAVFASVASIEEKRTAKEAAFATMRREYEALKREWGGASDYDRWFSQPLNNAHLASIATYRRWLPGLRWLLDARGLPAFYEEMESLAELSVEERRVRLESWLDGALSARHAPGVGTAAAAGARRGTTATPLPSMSP